MEGEKKGPERLKKALHGLKRAGGTGAAVGSYVHLGLTLAASTLLFFYGGYRIDRWLGTLPVFALVGTFVGAAGGFLYLYREVTAGERKKRSARRDA
jgi:F0F1-type ATP synthase assembly protein I